MKTSDAGLAEIASHKATTGREIIPAMGGLTSSYAAPSLGNDGMLALLILVVQQNEVISVLTVAATILLPRTLSGTIYGMTSTSPTCRNSTGRSATASS